MVKRWLGYAGFFLGMVGVALVVTGVFQERIWPRVSGTSRPGQAAVEQPPRAAATPGSPQSQSPSSSDGPPPDSRSAPAGAGVPVGPAPPPTERPSTAAGPGESVRKLAKVYEGMRPKEAAAVLERLERPLAASVLREIRERQASKILGAMTPATAAELTRMLGQQAEESRS